MLMPNEVAASSPSLIARQARPVRPRRMLQARKNRIAATSRQTK